MASPKIDPEKLYKVALAKTVRIGRVVVNPSDATQINGAALADLLTNDATAVLNYEAI